MIRQPPLFPQQNRPLPPWGRVGVGFVCIPAGQCSPPKTLPICRQTPTRVISTTSTPESVNPTPALPRGGRESISGKTGDRSRIPPLGGRFYGSGKMANATPSPALSRTTRELFQSRCGLRPAREGAERRKCKQPLPMPQPIHPLPCRTRQRPQRGRVGVGVRHVCSVHLSPIHAPICPLPLWGRVGVGFSDAASVFFRPSVCQNHHHRYRACFFTHLQGISAMSPVADDKPTPHPATINPTPALPCRGREPIGGNWGDRSRILPLGGRFCDCSKMANATPSPTLPRCGLRPAREEAERRKCKQPLSMPQPIYPLPCRTRQRRAAGEGRGGGSAIHHDNLT